jgi:NAD-dependent dihydropyrimidine dehydrogenase PreA subunit
MAHFRYLPGVSTLKLDADRCVGCGACGEVCPHGVFSVSGPKARIVDGDGCMECGACARNCPTAAVTVNPGVGCASYIIQTWIKGRPEADGGSLNCC